MALPLSEFETATFALADILRTADFILRDDAEATAECKSLLKRIAENRFNIVVAGRFNRGKSTLLNALLGSDYLPTAIVPLTSVITSVRFGNRERALLQYEDSRLSQEIALPKLPTYITEEGNPGNQRRIRVAQLEVPSEILRHEFFFVDTPGLASAILENTLTTESFLPEIDALILVTSFESPLSQDETSFLDKAAGRGVRRFFVVINKSDLVAEEDRERAVEFVRAKCLDLGFEALPMFPVSAKLGLAAKKARDREAVDRSGIRELEDALITFVTSDKSRVFLSRLVESVVVLLSRHAQNSKVDELLVRAKEVAGQVSLTTAANAKATGPHRDSLSETQSPRACEVCAKVWRRVFDFFSQFQLLVSVDAATRTSNIESGGLCFFHTWQYDKVASPRGTAAGYFPLLLSLAERLRTLAASSADAREYRDFVVESLATHTRCPACKVRAAAEATSLEEIKSHLSGTNRSPALCLPHLARLITEIDDAPTIRSLLVHEAMHLSRIAEALQRYALRHDALRRDLLTEEEELSPQLALQSLAGNKHVDALWFVDMQEIFPS